MIKKFDTKVQLLKYKVLREVARLAWNDKLEDILDIPKTIVPGKVPEMRCCVYKERAILAERVKLAMGGDKSNPNVIEVIDIACDECPAAGYEVTDSCRGCLAHRCAEVCKRGAIYFDHNHVAHIDKSKCVECGQCAKVCPFTAIINRKRPCQNACKIKAISINSDNAACIDNNKCIACGACVYQCPFGAIMDKSYILEAIDLLKKSEGGKNFKLYAIVAPSVSSQFTYAKLGQVVTGLKQPRRGYGGTGRIQRTCRKRIFDVVVLSGIRRLYQENFPRPHYLYIAQSFAYGDDSEVDKGNDARRQDDIYRTLHGKESGSETRYGKALRRYRLDF